MGWEGTPKTKLRFVKKTPNIWVTFVRKNRRDVHGRAFAAQEAIRIIEESDGYHVDFAGNIAGAWLPWESVSLETYKSFNAAARAARAYVERQEEE